jgi:Fe2+ or Zn2+ uptake regulation protein
MLAPEVHDEATARLRAVGQRYSAGRRTLVDLLGGSTGPLTIEAIRKLRPLPLSSVYRNLVVLEEAGVVRRVTSADDTPHFELAEGLGEHHHHLLCTRCGSVEDFVLPPAIEKALDRAVAAAADEASFEASAHHVELVGTCYDCRRRR